MDNPALNAEINRPDREADRSPPSHSEVQSEWSYASTPLRALDRE